MTALFLVKLGVTLILVALAVVIPLPKETTHRWNRWWNFVFFLCGVAIVGGGIALLSGFLVWLWTP